MLDANVLAATSPPGLEVPDYARSWGDVSRISSVPEGISYDERISPEFIFRLRTEDNPEGELVTSLRCELCTERKQACDRRRPACQRCHGPGYTCEYRDSAAGFVLLNTRRQRNAKSRARTADAPGPTSATTTHNQRDGLRGRSIAGRAYRPSARVRDMDGSVDIEPVECKSRRSNTCKSSAKRVPKLKPKSPRVSENGARQRRQDIDLCRKESASMFEEELVPGSPILSEYTPDASRHRRERHAHLRWTTARTSTPAPSIGPKPKSIRQPDLWAENKEDLFLACPDLGRAVSESTIAILLETLNCSHAAFRDEAKEVEISLSRVVTCSRKESEGIRKALSYFTFLTSPTSTEEPLNSPRVAMEASHLPTQCGSHDIAQIPICEGDNHLEKSCDSNESRIAHETISTFPMVVDEMKEPIPSTDTPSYDEIIETLPAHIRMIMGAYREGFPLHLFCSSTWQLLPVDLPGNIAFVFLGLFHVLNMKMTTDVTSTTSQTGRIVVVKLNITVLFKWTPEDSMRKWHHCPWWAISADESDVDELQNSEDDGLGDAMAHCGSSAFVPTSWVCIQCGKINRMRWVMRSNCDVCPIDENEFIYPTPHILPSEVREKMRPIPLWDAPRTLPSNWSETKKSWTDMMTHYRFIPKLENTPSSNLIFVDLTFTGDRPQLEGSADKLFDLFQEPPFGLILNNDDVKTPSNCFSSEYIHRAPEMDECVDCEVNTEDIVGYTTKCYSLAIQTMIDNARIYGKLSVSSATVKRVVAMTWPTEQRSKRTDIDCDSTTSPVFLMCLGADLDIHITIDETRISGDIAPVQKTSKRRDPGFKKDQLKVTLTHGCMLTLSGAHFKCRALRSGYSFLVMGA